MVFLTAFEAELLPASTRDDVPHAEIRPLNDVIASLLGAPPDVLVVVCQLLAMPVDVLLSVVDTIFADFVWYIF